MEDHPIITPEFRPLRTRSTLFFYVALDRSRANLAMARIALADVEKDLQV